MTRDSVSVSSVNGLEAQAAALYEVMTPAERIEVDRLLAADRRPWRPLPGPQTHAMVSAATIVGYGGAAGGGKSDLGIGLALTQHRRTLFCRQTGTELPAVVDRIGELLGTRDGWNGSDRIWRFRRHDGQASQVELGSFPDPGDERKYQGRPHDLIVFDEASNMRESAVRFLMGWLRTADRSQRCRVLMGFNPPTTTDGRWVVKFFAPWLERKHPRPAKPGELRWFAMLDGVETEVLGPDPIRHGGELIVPTSRTFVPSRVQDNPYYRDSGYMSVLQALPEPLRSQMLLGDFDAGIQDDPWQVIPTAWVEAAQARWRVPSPLPEQDSVGVDVARGGRDQTIIQRRHGMWFAEPIVLQGRETPDGPAVAGSTIAAQRDHAPIHIDVIGVGASPYDFLHQAGLPVFGVNVAERATGMDRSGRLGFKNLRSQLWWRAREALDPTNNTGIQLPPDPRLLADLTAPTWSLSGSQIAVASREEIQQRIGRSPDFGSAFVLALIDTPKRHVLEAAFRHRKQHDPYRALRGQQ